MSEFHTLTISDIVKETLNSVIITFEVPSDLQTIYQFKAGQYLTLKHEISGKEVRRAYSICSSINKHSLKVGIKKVPGGVFSEFATSELKVGDSIAVMPPKGKFVLIPNPTVPKNYLAFAAGSGITPILSMVCSVLELEPTSFFVLVYGNKSRDEAMFYNDLLDLQRKYPTQFHLESIFSRSHEDAAKFGRIDKSIVNFIIKNKFVDRDFDDFFICGPKTMIDEVKETLLDKGFPKEKIHFELFNVIADPFVEETHDGTTEVTCILDSETFSFSMPQNKTVLEAALDQKIDAPFSCQGGICSTCIARVTEGKAKMRKNQILTDSELEEGLILTCQAHPTTPTLSVDYDDV